MTAIMTTVQRIEKLENELTSVNEHYMDMLKIVTEKIKSCANDPFFVKDNINEWVSTLDLINQNSQDLKKEIAVLKNEK